MLGPPFVVGLEDSPFISFPVVFVVPLVSMHFHPYRIWNDTHSTNGIPFYILANSWGPFFIRSIIIFSCLHWHVALFFHTAGLPTVKHLALAAFCTLKVFSAANFVLWDIDPISLQAFKYSIREPVSRIGPSTD